MVDGSWVEVHCHFRCAGCQRRSPVNHLDLDGEVECLRCGEANDFDPGQWLDAIDHARACAHNEPGQAAEHGDDALRPNRIRQKTLVTRAAAGHPACQECQVELTVERCAVGMLVVSCPSCAHEWKYVLPRGTRASRPELGGAIAAAHARGGGMARLVEGGEEGARGIECPNCGAAVDHPTGTVVARCSYCRMTLRIPQRGLAAEEDLTPEPWWLFFPA